jgi:hypothetical protein
MTETTHMALPPYAPDSLHVWSKSGSKEGYFTHEAEKKLIIPNSHRFVAGCLKHHTWHAHSMRHSQWKFCSNPAGTKGILLLRQKPFYSINHLALKRGDSKITHGTAYPRATATPSFIEVGQKWRALYSWGRKRFSSLSRLAFQRDDSNIICGTYTAPATTTASFVEIGP